MEPSTTNAPDDVRTPGARLTHRGTPECCAHWPRLPRDQQQRVGDGHHRKRHRKKPGTGSGTKGRIAVNT